MLNLNSLIVFSEAPDKLTEFYTKVFGMEPGWEGGDFSGFKVGDGYLMIGPHDKVHGRNDAPERIMFNLETDDFEGEFQRIKETGAKVVAEPYHPKEDPKMMLATFADSDNNYFQLGTEME